MKLTSYDNLEDAKVKLFQTYCLYKGRAFIVKDVALVADKKFMVMGTSLASGRTVECMIDDPEFNCSNYNIGYVNQYHAAAWFYRIPLKQYRQGLRHCQVRLKASKSAYRDMSLGANKAVGRMLENDYPAFDEACGLIKEGTAEIIAFHKDFAMTYDGIHRDFLIEYKGENIGYTHDGKDFKLMDERSHLIEALKEAVG
jgi:hypothetical protein